MCVLLISFLSDSVSVSISISISISIYSCIWVNQNLNTDNSKYIHVVGIE